MYRIVILNPVKTVETWIKESHMMMDDRGVTGIMESKSPISEGSVFCQRHVAKSPVGDI